jgi:cytochrome b
MNSPKTTPDTTPPSAQLIWDAPTRVFHWLLVLCVAGAWVTAESERTKLLHLSFGYCAGALVLWRLVWGLFGSRYARFTDFVKSPAAAWAYLRGYLPWVTGAKPHAYVGHNPAGSWAVLGLLALLAGAVASGWWAEQSDALEVAGELHEALANGLLLLVGVHVLAVVATGLLQGENLVRAMVTGRKQAHQAQAIGSAHPLLGACVALATVALWLAIYTGQLPGLTA